MEDAGIIALYWDRDERAIPVTADKYGAYCAAIARNVLGNEQDAEECVNDTWLNAWNAMPPHRPNILSAFLGKIVRNLSFNRYRHNTAGKRGGGETAAVLEELEECVSGREDVEQTLERQRLVCVLNEFLDALSPQKRSIFVCRYWYTDSIPAIARCHGMGTGAVSMTLHRLRGKLRDHLLERGFEL